MIKKWLEAIEKGVTCISGRDYTAKPFSREWLLEGMAFLYGAGVHFHHWSFDKGVFRKNTLPCFVISIGNVVAGGAGKTPMAIYVAQLLQQMGKKPVVISRGYKGLTSSGSGIVSDGSQIFMGPADSGDEPYMMAQKKSFPVVVGKDRFRAGKKALEAFDPDVVILDDGFQHLKLKRDLDIVLFDYQRPLGNKKLLPAGRLREKFPDAGRRADVIVFTRSPREDKSESSIREVLGFYPGCPWFKTCHKPFISRKVLGKNSVVNPPEDLVYLGGKKVLLFSGIADNGAFCQSVTNLKASVLDHFEFKDHHQYQESDLERINAAALKLEADLILTTLKDWVKLEKRVEWETEVVVMDIKIAFEHPDHFKLFLKAKLETEP